MLNQESPTFIQDLTAVIAKLHPNVIYECLGGDVGGKIFALMPPASEMMIFGNLTHTPLVLDSGNIVFT